jgi:hypothetical protein
MQKKGPLEYVRKDGKMILERFLKKYDGSV